MEKTKITVELSTALYQQITSYAKHREISASAVVRFALLDYIEKNKIAPSEPAKPVGDTAIGPDGYTKAERDAIVERAKARAASTAERPRELSPTEPKEVRSFDDILSDWH